MPRPLPTEMPETPLVTTNITRQETCEYHHADPEENAGHTPRTYTTSIFRCQGSQEQPRPKYASRSLLIQETDFSQTTRSPAHGG